MFEEGFEFDPLSAGVGVFGGLLSLFVMKGVDTGLIYKIISFVLGTVICYFVFSFIRNKG